MTGKALRTLAALGLVLACSAAAAAQPAVRFERHEIETGTAGSQTVLTGFLTGGTVADLALVSADEHGGRRLRLHAFADGAWAPSLDVPLSPDVLFVDVARVAGRDRLITYERGELSWLDPDSVTEHALVGVRTGLLPKRGEGVPHVDVSRDLNGDGRDDLVVPDVDGFHVLVQRSDGTFADPVRVGPDLQRPGTYATYGYRHDPWSSGRVHEVDHDRDGRVDLVWWNEDHFEVRHQDEQGLFASAPVTFTTEVAFDTDDPWSLAAPLEARSRQRDRGLDGKRDGSVLHSIADFDGDGVPDLGVFALEGRNLWTMHSSYRVHLGSVTDEGLAFSREAGARIRSDGIPFGVGKQDFDGDGQTDLSLMDINPGVFMAIGGILTRSAPVSLEFWRMEDGAYSRRPSARRGTRSYALGKADERPAHFPAVRYGDVNGDGRTDLLVARRGRPLRVFPGVPGPRLFARRPVRVPVATPAGEELTWLADLDRDGRDDVLMHRASATEPQGVTLLIAR